MVRLGKLSNSNTKHYIMTQQFIEAFNALAAEAHNTSREKGWWDERDLLIKLGEAHSPEMGEFARNAIAGMTISLEHSELSESLEGIRAGGCRDDKVPEFSMEEAECADVIIRIMDRAQSRGLRVAEALVAKMAMNKTREHKHGGKTC